LLTKSQNSYREQNRNKEILNIIPKGKLTLTECLYCLWKYFSSTDWTVSSFFKSSYIHTLVDVECFIYILNLHASIEVWVSIHNFLLHDLYSLKDIFKALLSERIFLLSFLLREPLKMIKTNHKKQCTLWQAAAHVYAKRNKCRLK
jgi:hypothetical protein